MRGSFFGGGTMCIDGNMELRRSRGEEEKSRKAERSLSPDWRSSPLPYPARALVLFQFFDAAFNDLGEAYGAAFPLRGLV